MNIRIGYIGSAQSVAKNKQLAATISEIKFIPFTYSHTDDVPALYQAAQQQSDIICFSGIVPYFYRDHSFDSSVPVVITPFHEYMVVSSLLGSIAQNSIELHQLSIDLPKRKMMQEIEETIGYSFEPARIYDYQWIYTQHKERPFPFEEMVQFHLNQFTTGKTKMAITSVHSVYDQLNAKDIPVIYMKDYDNHLKKLLIDAKQKVLYSQMNESMIATLYITTKNGVTTADDEHIQTLLQNLVPLHGQNEDIQTLQYYTTRGVVSKTILHPLDDWIKQMEEVLEDHFSFGVGYGNQLFDAQQNAHDALQAATQIPGSNGFIVTEDNNRIGPLAGDIQTEKLRVHDDWLDEVITSSQTNMKTLQRFIQFMHVHNFQPFTTHELATYSSTTTRTAERFIKKLLEAKIIKSHGQEQHVQQGRPRTVYTITKRTENQFRTYIQKTDVSGEHVVESM